MYDRQPANVVYDHPEIPPAQRSAMRVAVCEAAWNDTEEARARYRKRRLLLQNRSAAAGAWRKAPDESDSDWYSRNKWFGNLFRRAVSQSSFLFLGGVSATTNNESDDDFWRAHLWEFAPALGWHLACADRYAHAFGFALCEVRVEPADEYDGRSVDHGIEIAVHAPDSVVVWVDPAQPTRLVAVLIRRAHGSVQRYDDNGGERVTGSHSTIEAWDYYDDTNHVAFQRIEGAAQRGASKWRAVGELAPHGLGALPFIALPNGRDLHTIALPPMGGDDAITNQTTYNVMSTEMAGMMYGMRGLLFAIGAGEDLDISPRKFNRLPAGSSVGSFNSSADVGAFLDVLERYAEDYAHTCDLDPEHLRSASAAPASGQAVLAKWAAKVALKQRRVPIATAWLDDIHRLAARMLAASNVLGDAAPPSSALSYRWADVVLALSVDERIRLGEFLSSKGLAGGSDLIRLVLGDIGDREISRMLQEGQERREEQQQQTLAVAGRDPDEQDGTASAAPTQSGDDRDRNEEPAAREQADRSSSAGGETEA